jgi:TatD DNase family protein
MQSKIPRYIDSHAHLFYEDFKEDIESVLARAQEAGVEYCIIPGTDLKSSRESIVLAEEWKNIFACVGIHPHEAAKATEKDLLEIEELSKHPKVVALGEIGLDYHYNFSPREQQREIFAAQIEIAVRRNLPVVVHTRESSDDAFSMIQQVVKKHPRWKESNSAPQRGVFHCFPGTAEEAEYVRKLGFYVSYPGILTFKKSQSIEEIRKIGVHNILLETDSPYMTPVPFRGQRNEPANIVYIGRKLAEAFQIPEEEVARMTTENAIRLFGLPHMESQKNYEE